MIHGDSPGFDYLQVPSGLQPLSQQVALLEESKQTRRFGAAVSGAAQDGTASSGGRQLLGLRL